MASAAVAALAADGLAPAGGVVAGPSAVEAPHPRLVAVVGDHPEPGAGSRRAAEAVGSAVVEVGAGDEAWILLSGGTTSLIGAPIDGIEPGDLAGLYHWLLGSGLDIAAMNRVRKRFSRWGGGRLAAALAHASVRCWVVSDVIGDDLAAIGSGPCVGDPTTAADIRALLAEAGLLEQIPAPLRQHLATVEGGRRPETPKPGDPAVERVEIALIVSNRLALEAAARRATELGLAPEVMGAPIAGEAAAAGASVAAMVLEKVVSSGGGQRGTPSRCTIWGGETTVTLGESPGVGG